MESGIFWRDDKSICSTGEVQRRQRFFPIIFHIHRGRTDGELSLAALGEGDFARIAADTAWALSSSTAHQPAPHTNQHRAPTSTAHQSAISTASTSTSQRPIRVPELLYIGDNFQPAPNVSDPLCLSRGLSAFWDRHSGPVASGSGGFLELETSTEILEIRSWSGI